MISVYTSTQMVWLSMYEVVRLCRNVS